MAKNEYSKAIQFTQVKVAFVLSYYFLLTKLSIPPFPAATLNVKATIKAGKPTET